MEIKVLEKSVNRLYANIGKLITSSLKFNEILQGIMEEVHIFFNPEYWSLLRVDEISDELYFVIFNGPVNIRQVSDIRLKMGEGVAGSVAKNRKSYFVRDTSTEKNFSHRVDARTGFHTKSIIAVPLVYRETVYGVIEIINPSDGSLFSEEELFILQTIADFSAIAFANAALYDSVIKISQTDTLTGAYNRLKFNEIVDQWKTPETRHRRRVEKDFISVIILDLNDFKLINDTYGHMIGDEILKTAASFFKLCIREDDLLFRIGGDEFLILLQCATDKQLAQAQERILDLLNRGNHVRRYRDIELSYAFGTACGSRIDIAKIIELADSNMYLVKKNNC